MQGVNCWVCHREEAKKYENEGLVSPGWGYWWRMKLEMAELHIDKIPEDAIYTRINKEFLYWEAIFFASSSLTTQL